MDSFYDAPRRPPQPIPRETFSATPVVPEISVLCSTTTNVPRNNFMPYTQWKRNARPGEFVVENKENINGNFHSTQNNSILKKQVRFESPVLQQRSPVSSEALPNNFKQNFYPNQIINGNSNKPDNQVQALLNFEQMYMANIPNRQLDLSVVDLPKRLPSNEIQNECTESKNEVQPTIKELPKSYREFLETQKIENKIILNDSVTDIYNYKRNGTSPNSCSPKAPHYNLENNKNQYIPMSAQVSLKNQHCSVSPPASQSNLKDQIETRAPTTSQSPFQRVTQAIAKREYKKSHNDSVEQMGYPKNDTPKKSEFISQNNENGVLQNRLFSPNVRNNQNNVGHWLDNQRNKDFLGNSTSKDTQSRQNRKTIGLGVENNQDILMRQVNNGIQTDYLVFGPPLTNVDTCRIPNYPENSQKKRECFTQTSDDVNNFGNNAVSIRCEDDFSVKDLLKIIAQQSQQITQQNQQLLLMQQQISQLICKEKDEECPRQKSIQCGQEKNCCQQKRDCCERLIRHCCSEKQQFLPGFNNKNVDKVQDRCITSTQHENCEDTKKKSDGTPKKNKNLQNFSIGLTTSFEVSFKRPHNKDQNDFLQQNKEFAYLDQHCDSPKIQEITETDSTPSSENYWRNQQVIQKNNDEVSSENKETLMDDSMIFKEPIRVREPCPSPEPSIKINMNDFEDSESEDDSSEIGASFYRNLMVQVNKILQKAQIETTEEVAYNFRGQNLKSHTLHKVKEATLKHLKSIGVDVANSEDSSESSSLSDETNGKSYEQEDISFAVKQLLMKYLPADHLARLAYKEAQPGNYAVLTPKEKIGVIKNRPDFSFATVQYMKKYNLIAHNQKDFPRATKQNQRESPKILDITKLKQQPKLL